VVDVSSAVSSEVSPAAAEVIAPTTMMAPEAPRPKAQPRTQPRAQPKIRAAIEQPAIQPEPVPEAPAEATPVSAVQQQEEVATTVEVEAEASRPAAPPLPDPRRRLRELLAIPDRDRTDALWDELIELEIQLAPGNRAPGPNANAHADVGRSQKPGRFAGHGRHQDSSNGAPRHGNRPDGAGPGANGTNGTPGAPRPAKRFFKKAKRGPRPPAKV